MPHQVHGVLLHAMSGTELSRVRTELRLLLREHINQRLLTSRAADIVMQSSAIGPIRTCLNLLFSSAQFGRHRLPQTDCVTM